MNLKVVNLSKTYSGKVEALKQITLEFAGAGLNVLTGDNGSGKTTLFNLIAGLDKPTTGQILYNGVDVGAMKEKELQRYRRDSVSYIFQDYNLLDDISVYENVALAYGGTDKTRIDDALNKVEMFDYKDTKAGELSGGQKQRVAIARAFVKESAIVLADEITANLDREISGKIIRLLYELAKVKCVIVITHNKEKFEGYYNREIRLSKGEIAFDQSIENGELQDIEEKKNGKIGISSVMGFVRSNLFKRKAKKVYLLVFSVIMLTVTMISISSISNGYKPMMAKLMNEFDYKYIACQAAPDVFEGSSFLLDNDYTAVTDVTYNAPSNAELYWLPMKYGRSEHVLEINSAVSSSEDIYGRAPTDVNEIAITDYCADFIIGHGDKDGEQFLTYDDILRKAEIVVTYLKSSFSLRVVGIVKTDYKKFDALKNAAPHELSFTLDDSYFNSALRWKMNGMFEDCASDNDREFYLFLTNTIKYYNVFYVCDNFESLNYDQFEQLNLSDQFASKHNVPTFYSLIGQDNISGEIHYVANAPEDGIIVPLSRLADKNVLNDLYAVYGSKDAVYSEIASRSHSDVTIEIKEMVVQGLESFAPERIIISKKFKIQGFYNDFFDQETATNYYINTEEYKTIRTELALYKPTGVSVYLDFHSIGDKEAILTTILGNYVPNNRIDFPEKQIVDQGYSKLKMVQAVFIALFALMLIMSVVFLVQIIIDDIKENERNYAILKSLGFSNMQLTGIALFTPVLLFLIAAVVSVALAFGGVAVLNVWLVNDFMKISIVRINILGGLAIIGIILLSLGIGAFAGLRRLIKKPPIENLKQIRHN